MSYCVAADKGGGPKKPYDEDNDPCEHEYDEDEDAGEFVCVMCGDRQPMDLTDLIK